MWIQGIGTAVPPTPTSQKDTLEFILSSFEIGDRTRQLYKKTLSNQSIKRRHFSLSTLDQVLDQDHDRKSVRFELDAARLSAESLQRALANAGVGPKQLDFLAVTTCTGYVCPGLSAHVVERAGLRDDIRAVDLVGMGCGAAVPALEQARHFLMAYPSCKAAVVSTEICSAAMFSNNDVDIVISNTLFADGSAAVVLGKDVSAGQTKTGAVPVIRDFESLVLPEWRDTLRFRTENGHLRNVLGKDVPAQAAQAMKIIVGRLFHRNSVNAADVRHWIFHAGGERVLNAIEGGLSLPASALESSRRILRDYGNMSSPTVLFVLAEEMRVKNPAAGSKGFLASFGAGFSAYGALIEWT